MKELEKPAATSTTCPPHRTGSGTCVGTGQSLQAPKPSCPKQPTPKAKTCRSSVSAKVCCQPQATRATRGRPSTALDVGRSSTPRTPPRAATSSSQDQTSPSLDKNKVEDSPTAQETILPLGRAPAPSTSSTSRGSSEEEEDAVAPAPALPAPATPSPRRSGSATGCRPATMQRPPGADTKTEWLRPAAHAAIDSPSRRCLSASSARPGALTKTSSARSPDKPS
mmetsp:Transcript_64513/g.185498  ORF Transcript_64513/g.185498 Transcript_64513/m.185498 type:complete len:224 (-) Transcript_64513:344-1015(-)